MLNKLNKKELKILALIPARGGSKGIPKKNIVNLGGYPLIAYSIAAARLSKYINRVIVTTDDEGIAVISRRFGAEAPFLRPKKISGDRSLDIEFFEHALGWLRIHEKYQPDLIVHLRPSTPLREAAIIDKAILEILKDKLATALRSAEIFNKELPYKLFKKRGNYCSFFGSEDFKKNIEYYNYPRQRFPLIYRPNGYADIVLPRVLLKTGFLHGRNITAFITDKAADIDNIEDLQYAKEISSDKKYEPLFNILRKPEG